jgi:hypothetical protein
VPNRNISGRTPSMSSVGGWNVDENRAASMLQQKEHCVNFLVRIGQRADAPCIVAARPALQCEVPCTGNQQARSHGAHVVFFVHFPLFDAKNRSMSNDDVHPHLTTCANASHRRAAQLRASRAPAATDFAG